MTQPCDWLGKSSRVCTSAVCIFRLWGFPSQTQRRLSSCINTSNQGFPSDDSQTVWMTVDDPTHFWEGSVDH